MERNLRCATRTEPEEKATGPDGGQCMTEITLNSSLLAACAYDPDKQLLRIRFRNGGLYVYQQVPMAIIRALLQATSHGQYFNTAIRGKFPFRRLSWRL